MPIDLICLDADDTLWHNMRHFDETERLLFDLLAPLAEVEAVRARLQAIGGRNLAIYGYGAKSFTLSMIETASELAGHRLSADIVNGILAAGRSLHAHPVELLPDVEKTLEALSKRAELVLVTKGDLLHQETKLAASGLGERFSAIDIVSDKTPETYRRIFARHDVAAEHALMVGDSMRSDILPALEAGAFAAHLPNALAWFHEKAEAPEDHPRFRRLERMADLVPWVDALAE